jgi:hypothetical protein
MPYYMGRNTFLLYATLSSYFRDPEGLKALAAVLAEGA